MADINPTPPRIIKGDAFECRELADKIPHQQIFILLIRRVPSGNGAAAANLNAPIRQKAIVVTQDAGIGDDQIGTEITCLDFFRRKRSRHNGVGQNR